MAVRYLSESTLVTPRLELWHLSIEDMQSLVEDPISDSVWAGKPFINPHGVFVDDLGPIPWRLPQALKNPESHKWFIRLIIEKSSREVVGSLSFHEPPNEHGMLEVGLGIVDSKQRQGYATEALCSLWAWASQFPEVRVFRYCVGVTNTASIGLIQSLGFARVGQQIDPIDGPEEIYEMSVPAFRTKYQTGPAELAQ